MVIQVKVDGIYLIAIQPFSTPVEREELVLFLLKHNLHKVGFIDLAPTKDIFDLLKSMDSQGINTCFFADHHENEEKADEIINARAIYEYIENDNFRFLPRLQAPSACGLAKANEAKRLGLNAIFFHYDIDGFSGALKMTYLGKIYTWLDDVANLAEKSIGSSSLRLTPNANRYMRLMQAGMNVGPPYQFDPLKRNIALRELYSNVAIWLQSEMNDIVIIDFINELIEVNEEATELSYEILQSVKRDEGIIFVDCFKYMNSGKRPNFQVLKKELFNLAEGFMLVAIRVLGHKGDQISIFKPRDFDLYLPSLMPFEEKGDWHIASRIHIKSSNFSEFKKNYLNAVSSIIH
jgi:hypothetical protein